MLCSPPDLTQPDPIVGCYLIDFIAGSTANFTLTFQPVNPANFSVEGAVLPDPPLNGQIFDINPDNNFAVTCMNMVRAPASCREASGSQAIILVSAH